MDKSLNSKTVLGVVITGIIFGLLSGIMEGGLWHIGGVAGGLLGLGVSAIYLKVICGAAAQCRKIAMVWLVGSLTASACGAICAGGTYLILFAAKHISGMEIGKYWAAELTFGIAFGAAVGFVAGTVCSLIYGYNFAIQRIKNESDIAAD